jgi:flagellar hook-associated protein 2
MPASALAAFCPSAASGAFAPGTSGAFSAFGAAARFGVRPPDQPEVGASRLGRPNPFAPGGTLPLVRRSFLARLGRTEESETQHRQFGLGDHIGAPLTQLESQLTAAIANTVDGLMRRAAALRAAAGTLVSGTPDGVFDRRAASSTGTAVSARARDGATLASYDVRVAQLAVAQQNAGDQLLSAEAPTQIAPGLHTFEVTSGGVTSPVAVTIGATDTNLEALTAVRDAVNAAGVGIEASIVTTRDVSQLVLTATRTGTANAFGVADVFGGSIVSSTGTATATRAAADALVEVDGVEHTLSENRLTLDVPETGLGATARLELDFHDETDGAVRIDVTVAYDAAAVVAATQRLSEAVNDVRSYVEDKPQILSRGLLGRLDVAVNGLREALADVGVQSSAGGALSVDEGALRLSLDRRPADVERAIGSLQGLAARERSVAETILESSAVAFATKPGPLGSGYGRTLVQTARLHNYLLGGLFVDVFA